MQAIWIVWEFSLLGPQLIANRESLRSHTSHPKLNKNNIRLLNPILEPISPYCDKHLLGPSDNVQLCYISSRRDNVPCVRDHITNGGIGTCNKNVISRFPLVVNIIILLKLPVTWLVVELDIFYPVCIRPGWAGDCFQFVSHSQIRLTKYWWIIKLTKLHGIGLAIAHWVGMVWLVCFRQQFWLNPQSLTLNNLTLTCYLLH